MSVSDAKLLHEQGYDLIGDIGEGAYSKVKLFYSHALKQTVAIKIINRQQAPRDFVKNFLPRELEILQKVKHPNIVSIYEILATSDGRIFIILEYSTHNDVLRHIQNNGALDEDRAKHLFGQLVEAVAYLHRNNIVHRDLKCENLLLTHAGGIRLQENPTINLDRFKDSEGKLLDMTPDSEAAKHNIKIEQWLPGVKNHKIRALPLGGKFDPQQIKLLLTDFGFGKIITNPDEKSRSFCGSAAYAAPEIIQGIPYIPTSHDTWSLGIVLFIMVCGTMPYDDSNVRQMVKEQLAHKIRFPPQAAYNLSLQCKDLISKLIEPDPKKRLTIHEIQQHPWIANRLKYGSYSKSSSMDHRKIDTKTKKNSNESSSKLEADKFTAEQTALMTSGAVQEDENMQSFAAATPDSPNGKSSKKGGKLVRNDENSKNGAKPNQTWY